LHGRRLGDEFRPPFGAQQAVFRFQDFGLPHRPPQLDLGAHNRDEPRVFPRLLDEIAGAATHRLHRQIYVRPGGHYDDAQTAVMRTQLGKQFQTFRAGGCIAGVIEVDEKGVEGFTGHPIQDLTRRLGSGYPVTLGLQQQLDCIQNMGLIIGGQNPGRVRWCACGLLRGLRVGCHHCLKRGDTSPVKYSADAWEPWVLRAPNAQKRRRDEL